MYKNILDTSNFNNVVMEHIFQKMCTLKVLSLIVSTYSMCGNEDNSNPCFVLFMFGHRVIHHHNRKKEERRK